MLNVLFINSEKLNTYFFNFFILVDDLVANIEYISYSRTHPLIVWLVNILFSYDQKALAKLLFFITGEYKIIKTIKL